MSIADSAGYMAHIDRVNADLERQNRDLREYAVHASENLQAIRSELDQPLGASLAVIRELVDDALAASIPASPTEDCPICDAKGQVVPLRMLRCMACDTEFAGREEINANAAAGREARKARGTPEIGNDPTKAEPAFRAWLQGFDPDALEQLVGPGITPGRVHEYQSAFYAGRVSLWAEAIGTHRTGREVAATNTSTKGA